MRVCTQCTYCRDILDRSRSQSARLKMITLTLHQSFLVNYAIFVRLDVNQIIRGFEPKTIRWTNVLPFKALSLISLAEYFLKSVKISISKHLRKQMSPPPLATAVVKLRLHTNVEAIGMALTSFGQFTAKTKLPLLIRSCNLRILPTLALFLNIPSTSRACFVRKSISSVTMGGTSWSGLCDRMLKWA